MERLRFIIWGTTSRLKPCGSLPPAASFYVDLGQAHQLERVNIFGGVGTGKFQLEFSQSPDNWSSPLDVSEDVGNVFIWKSQPLNVSARYVKLTVTSPGFTLNEVAFYGQEAPKTPLQIAGVTPMPLRLPKEGRQPICSMSSP